MLDQFIMVAKDALAGIDRAYVIEQLTHARDSLPFDYKVVLGYGVVALGAYTFTWLVYRLITEPTHSLSTSLLNRTDKAFMSALTHAVAPYSVFPHVSVNSVISTRSLSRKRRRKARAKTAALRYDYLVCDDDMRVIAAVDFRRKRLFEAGAIKRGIKNKRKVSKQSGLPLITFDRKYVHTSDEIRKYLARAAALPSRASTPDTHSTAGHSEQMVIPPQE